MYTLEQKQEAIDVYLQVNSMRKTIQLLGYPGARQTLKKWINEYKTNGKTCIPVRKPRKPAYTNEQITYAINYYLSNGQNITHTCNDLGYPCRTVLSRWISEKSPDHPKHKLKDKPLLKYSYNDKIVGALKLSTRTGTADNVSKNIGASRCSLYKWKKQLLPKRSSSIMENTAIKENASNISELENQVNKLKQEIHILQLEKDALEAASALIKKAKGVNLQKLANCEKAIIIDTLRDKYCLKELLLLFDISKSSYFYPRSVQKRPDKYQIMRSKIRKIFQDSGNTYGYRRLHAVLKRNSIVLSEKVVRRIMKEEHLTIMKVRIRKYCAYKGEISPAVPNLIKRDFHAALPNQKWLTDITEFHIPAGKIYLSPIIDCFDGLPVAWTIGTSPNAELVNTMLDTAISTLPNGAHPIVHSDRGCHYRWPGWIKRIEDSQLIRSMSKKGCSPNNAACEAFFGRLKNEMFYNHNWTHVTIDEFIDAIDNYMHWYSTKRIKISLGAMSPMEYRRSLGLVS